jgi:hypothetical protein
MMLWPKTGPVRSESVRGSATKGLRGALKTEDLYGGK